MFLHQHRVLNFDRPTSNKQRITEWIWTKTASRCLEVYTIVMNRMLIKPVYIRI